MANHRIYQELVNRNEVLKTMLVYHLQKGFGKFGWTVNGTRLLGRSSGNYPGATEHLKR